MGDSYVSLIALAGAAMGVAAPFVAARMVESRTKAYRVPSALRVVMCALVGLVTAGSIARSLGPTTETLEYVALIVPLMTAALTDLDVWLIPRDCVWFMLAVRALSIVVSLVRGGAGAAGASATDALLGVLAVGAPLLVATVSMERTQQGRDALGGGDVRLLVAVGAIFGWLGAALALMLSCLFGIVHYYACYQQKGEGRTFPFAPSIALACWAVSLCQPLLADLAVRLFA